MNSLQQYNAYVEQLNKTNHDINDLKLSVGYKECYSILRKFFPFDYFDAVNIKIQRIDSMQKKALTNVMYKGENYDVILIPIDEYDRTTHIELNAIILDLDSTARKVFLAQLTLLETWLLENSQIIFADINSNIKYSKQIKILEGSKNKRFQYHYSASINKKLIFVACLSV